jgi:plastocyanin
MMRRAALIAIAAAAGAIACAPAQAETLSVAVLFQAFSPTQLDALPGDTIQWSNGSDRTHTVTADDGSFDSGDLLGGATFALTAGAPGTYAFHCRIHPDMTGEINVSHVTLAGLPQVAVPAGDAIAVHGRTDDPLAPVSVERDLGSGFHPVATVMPAPNGNWSAKVTADATGEYRAVAGLGASANERLLVIDRHLSLTPTSRGVRVTITPPLPYGRLVLQRNTRERFGWFPVARKRLDYASRAAFTVQRPATVRVALVDRDGWTPLALSPPLHLRRA